MVHIVESVHDSCAIRWKKWQCPVNTRRCICIWWMTNMIQGATQGERQFLFDIRVGCVVVWPIFSTSKMKAFCIYFYQGNITFKNIINLVSFIINLVEYLVINLYSVIVLDNFRKETSDRAKKHHFLEVFNSLTVIMRNPHPLPPTPSWSARFDESISLTVWFFFYHISTGKKGVTGHVAFSDSSV